MITEKYFELYYGPMKSGKTKALIERVRGIDPRHFMFIKPSIDTRNNHIWSRAYPNHKYPCKFVDHEKPMTLIEAITNERTIKPGLSLIAIDEVQFFQDNITYVLNILLRDYNIIASGLDRDFRGEFFGEMSDLITLADYRTQLFARCEFPGCGKEATRTQRLIDGRPARYDSPLVVIDGGEEKYEARCLEHHIVLK